MASWLERVSTSTHTEMSRSPHGQCHGMLQTLRSQVTLTEWLLVKVQGFASTVQRVTTPNERGAMSNSAQQQPMGTAGAVSLLADMQAEMEAAASMCACVFFARPPASKAGYHRSTSCSRQSCSGSAAAGSANSSSNCSIGPSIDQWWHSCSP